MDGLGCGSVLVGLAFVLAMRLVSRLGVTSARGAGPGKVKMPEAQAVTTDRQRWAEAMGVECVGELVVGYVDERPANGCGRLTEDGWQMFGRSYGTRYGIVTLWDDNLADGS